MKSLLLVSRGDVQQNGEGWGRGGMELPADAAGMRVGRSAADASSVHESDDFMMRAVDKKSSKFDGLPTTLYFEELDGLGVKELGGMGDGWEDEGRGNRGGGEEEEEGEEEEKEMEWEEEGMMTEEDLFVLGIPKTSDLYQPNEVWGGHN